MHCQVTLAALAAKKHVLCEARMAINLEEAQKMHKAAQQNPNLVTQVVPSPMTLEYDQTIIDLIKQDRLGRILAVELKAAGRFIDPDEPMHWRYDIELSGLNTMSLGIWYESLMRWIGPAKKVSAMAKTFVKKRKDDKNKTHKIQIPDHLDIIAEMDCGAMALMRFSQVTGCDDGPKVSLFGSKATLTLAGDKLLFGTRQENKLREITINPEKRGKWRVEKEFINAIRSKEKVKLTTFKNGLKYMEFTEAAIKSARTAQTIDLS
jgi:predicted dehydrogenase